MSSLIKKIQHKSKVKNHETPSINDPEQEIRNITEDENERIIQHIKKEMKIKPQVKELVVGPPSRRRNFCLVPHPEKEELILFGGELYNGDKTFMYDDLFFYNIQHNRWKIVKSPNNPPPRCAHQMCTTSEGGNKLWMFGGEYTAPKQTEFYHYRDLWVYHLDQKWWEKITAFNGPNGRSGHRMVSSKNKLYLFGGYHKGNYYNDVYCFNVSKKSWERLEVKGEPPSPRSGCIMAALPDGKILISGGYSKEKRSKGVIHTDSFLLIPKKRDEDHFRWSATFLGGNYFSTRIGTAVASTDHKLYIFGGIFDTTTDSRHNISSTFYNGLYVLDLKKLVWKAVINSKQSKESKSKTSSPTSSNISKHEEQLVSIQTVGVFKIASNKSSQSTRSKTFWPSPRMSAGLAVKNNILFLFGGLFEDGKKEIVLADFYSINLEKLDSWNIHLNDDLSKLEWVESETESSADDSTDDESIVKSNPKRKERLS